MSAPVIIVGAGMAGLACARSLHRAGRSFQLFEAASALGGRVRTDITEEGFRLDRGFQVLLTAYPEVHRQINRGRLQPRAFRSGAIIRLPDGQETILRDPLRDPRAAVAALRAPIGSLTDKMRLGVFVAGLLGRDANALLSESSISTLDFLRRQGWSEEIIARFFVPFFGGVFLDRSLSGPAGFFKFVFQQFVLGRAVLPALGMQRLPEQLAEALPKQSVHLGARVETVSSGGVRLSNGQFREGSHVVLAVEGSSAHRLLPAIPAPEGWRKTTCLYFAAAHSPGKGDGYLRLNATTDPVVHNVCFPSDIAPEYAPRGSTLVSASVHGGHALDEATLLAKVRLDLAAWFGEAAMKWRHLRSYELPFALPTGPQALPAARLTEGVYVCGDHTAYPSLNAALATGRLTAEAILLQN